VDFVADEHKIVGRRARGQKIEVTEHNAGPVLEGHARIFDRVGCHDARPVQAPGDTSLRVPHAMRDVEGFQKSRILKPSEGGNSIEFCGLVEFDTSSVQGVETVKIL
jgi:hypothetical protein